MPATRIAGVLVFLLTAGCGGIQPAPPREPAGTAATQEKAEAVKAPQTATARDKAIAVEPAAPPAAPAMSGSERERAVKTDVPAAKSSARIPTTPALADKVRKEEGAAPGPGKPAASPPLDLTLLEKRLKETDAIGVFTKLTLKNQVDDLLDQFRAYYQGRLKASLAELRQPYDMLILKVLSLLQDRDPSLAKAILASREAIWSILSNPAKFSNLEKLSRDSSASICGRFCLWRSMSYVPG